MKRNIIIAIVSVIIIIVLGFILLGGKSTAEKVTEQLELGNKYLNEGNYKEAIISFNKAIEIEPKNVEARLGLADVYVTTEEYDKAEDVLNEAIEIDKTNKEGYLKLIEVYEKTDKDIEDIVALIQEGYENTDNNIFNKKLEEKISELIDSGNKNFSEGKYNEAVTVFNIVLKIDNKNIKAMFGLADSYVQIEEYQTAENILRELIKIDKTNSKGYLKLVEMYKKIETNTEKLKALLQEAYDNTKDETFLTMLNKLLIEKPKMNVKSIASSVECEITFTNIKKGESVYYTLDDTKPTKNSKKYTEDPLIEDGIYISKGNHIVRAIKVNEDGFESEESKFECTITNGPEVWIRGRSSYDKDVPIITIKDHNDSFSQEITIKTITFTYRYLEHFEYILEGIDKNGEKLWDFTWEFDKNKNKSIENLDLMKTFSMVSPYTISEDKIYIIVSNTLHVFDLKTGNLRWKTELKDPNNLYPMWLAPVVDGDGTVYCVHDQYWDIISVNPSGSINWKKQASYYPVYVKVDNDYIYVMLSADAGDPPSWSKYDKNGNYKPMDTNISVQYDDLKVAAVFDYVMDDFYDKPTLKALLKAEEKLNIESSYKVAKESNERNRILQELYDEGNNLILCHWILRDEIVEAAKRNPNQKYAIIGASYYGEKYNNLINVDYRIQESAFLVGYIAGKMTKTNKVGFVGGMDISVVKSYEYGFVSGVKYANSDVEILKEYAGSFTESSKGKVIGDDMYSQGVDIISHAAGPTGNGIIESAKDNNKYVIGCDSDQNHLAPDNVITSTIVRIDNLVYKFICDFKNGMWNGGKTIEYGLKEGCVDIAPSTNKHVPKELLKEVEEIKKKIINGEIKVPSN